MSWLPPTYATVRDGLAEAERLIEDGNTAICPVTGEFAPWFDLVDVRTISALLPTAAPFVSSMGWRRWVDARVEVDGAPLTRRRWAELLGAPVPHVDTIVEGMALTLEQVQAERFDAIRALRNSHIDSGVTVAGIGRFDTDATSRANITGAVTGALMASLAAQPFSINWSLADYSIVALNAAAMQAVGGAVLAYVSACHAHAQTLAAAVQTAVDIATLNAIDIDAGWPG